MITPYLNRCLMRSWAGVWIAPLVTKCIACDRGADLRSLPFCAGCVSSLVPLIGPVSLHPDPNPISSWHALYLAVGQSYSVLRAWKKTPSPLADRWILRPQSQLHRSLKQLNADFLAPVPQRVQRSWSLGRSPAQQLSEFFAKWLSLPTESVLEINAGSTPQAQLSLQERLERPGPFEMRRPWRDLISGKTVLLVDDFITSGRTLRNAALVLKRAGVKEVHVACLAIRPGKTNDPS